MKPKDLKPRKIGVARKCPDFNCSGLWDVWTHAPDCDKWKDYGDRECTCHIKDKVWVAPHKSLVFIQCNECGTSRS